MDYNSSSAKLLVCVYSLNNNSEKLWGKSLATHVFAFSDFQFVVVVWSLDKRWRLKKSFFCFFPLRMGFGMGTWINVHGVSL